MFAFIANRLNCLIGAYNGGRGGWRDQRKGYCLGRQTTFLRIFRWICRPNTLVWGFQCWQLKRPFNLVFSYPQPYIFTLAIKNSTDRRMTPVIYSCSLPKLERHVNYYYYCGRYGMYLALQSVDDDTYVIHDWRFHVWYVHTDTAVCSRCVDCQKQQVN